MDVLENVWSPRCRGRNGSSFSATKAGALLAMCMFVLVPACDRTRGAALGSRYVREVAFVMATPGVTDSALVAAQLDGVAGADLVAAGDGGVAHWTGGPGGMTERGSSVLPAFVAGCAGALAGDFNGDGDLDLLVLVAADTLEQPDEVAGKDAFLDGNDPDANYGVQEAFLTKKKTAGAEALLQFDAGLLPAGRTLDRALVSLYHVGLSLNGATLAVYPNTVGWDETTVTWNTAPTHETTAAGTLAVADSASRVRREIEITALYDAWRTGASTNHGLTLSRTDTGNERKIGAITCSSDWAGPIHTNSNPNALNPALRPQVLLFHHASGAAARTRFKPVLLYYSSGTWVEQSTSTFPAWAGDWTGAAWADVDGDGPKDFVLASARGGHQVLLQDAAGTGVYNVVQNLYQAIGQAAQGVAAGDLDSDGDQDLVFHDGGGAVTVWVNNGSGLFNDPNDPDLGAVQVPTGLGGGVGGAVGGGDLVLVDIDADGDLDLLVSGGVGVHLRLLLNNGTGAFQAKDLGGEYKALAAADMNADGMVDILALDAGSGRPRLLEKRATVYVEVRDAFPELAALTGLTVGDFDGDGRLDVAVSYVGGSGVEVLVRR